MRKAFKRKLYSHMITLISRDKNKETKGGNKQGPESQGAQLLPGIRGNLRHVDTRLRVQGAI